LVASTSEAANLAISSFVPACPNELRCVVPEATLAPTRSVIPRSTDAYSGGLTSFAPSLVSLTSKGIAGSIIADLKWARRRTQSQAAAEVVATIIEATTAPAIAPTRRDVPLLLVECTGEEDGDCNDVMSVPREDVNGISEESIWRIEDVEEPATTVEG